MNPFTLKFVDRENEEKVKLIFCMRLKIFFIYIHSFFIYSYSSHLFSHLTRSIFHFPHSIQLKSKLVVQSRSLLSASFSSFPSWLRSLSYQGKRKLRISHDVSINIRSGGNSFREVGGRSFANFRQICFDFS